MATSRIGTITIAIDGEWDIDDLRSVSESLSESYGLFYPLVAEDEVVRERLQDSLRQTFWSGNVDTRYIGERLYRQIPHDDSLKLKSFHYSSPGHMEIVGYLAVLYLMARVALIWLRAGDGVLELWKKVDKFFETNKHLRRPKKTTELDDAMVISAEEARELVFEIGGKLGFTSGSCETLIATVGNPISTLKFLVVVGREGRKLAGLQQEGKLMLPPPSDELIEIRPSATTRKRQKGQVEVVRTRSQKRPREE
jgi:hypothetical protein